MAYKQIIFALLFFLIFDLIFCSIDCEDVTENNLVLNTLNGKVKGECDDVTIYYANKSETTIPVMNWLAIPYAEPPVGKLRFNKPQPVKSWSNIRSGRKLPKQCVQLRKNPEDSEDCLYLSVYSPYESYLKSVIKKDKSSLMPVFVWIHGGSYINGSGADYDPSMISAYSNIVSVTINYRLGALTFLGLSGTNAPGNLLLHDQQLAMKWIYDNAEKFGGDRNRITICGESAGASSVGYHLLFKSSWSYYKNAILQSGVPVPDFNDHYTPKKADEITKKVASKVGCNSKSSNQDILNCLQSADPYKLNSVTMDITGFPIIVFDKELFLEQPIFLFQKGDFKKNGNILTGYTSYEQLSLANDELTDSQIESLKEGDYQSFEEIIQNRLDLNNKQLDTVIKRYLNPSQINNKNEDYFYHYIVIVSDYEYKCSTHEFAELASKHNRNIYAYLYAHKSSTSIYPSKFDGAAHAEEIEFMFGTPLFYKNNYKANEKLFAEQMITYWTSFVKANTPSLNYEWPRYADTNSATDRNLFYLRMNQNKNTIFKTTKDICKFWIDLGVFINN